MEHIAERQVLNTRQLSEDFFNTVTHGIGFLASIVALSILTYKAYQVGGAAHVAACLVFGISLLFVYGSSTMYHGLFRSFFQKPLQLLDHLTIFVLIAGSYTPFTIVTLDGFGGWSVFGMVWGIAIIGIVFKLIFPRGFQPFWVAYYLAMGWFGLFILEPLYQLLPEMSYDLLCLGGYAYTLGVIFFAWEKLPYNHGIWHLFVLAGSTMHFFSVYILLG